MYDCVIIGAGPAGLSAAIYAGRGGLDYVIIDEHGMGGGQIISTESVDNYPGLPGIGGFELGQAFQNHAMEWKAEIKACHATGIEDKGDYKIVSTSAGDLECRAVIIATGAVPKLLGIPGEKELRGMGVSYCATCDGAFFRGRQTAVIGGGDVALEDALYLSRLCTQVYLIHRRDSFRAADSIRKAVMARDNIKLYTGYVPLGINGHDSVSGVTIKDVNTDEVTELEASAVFIAVGNRPVTDFTGSLVDKDENGYILADESGITNIPGIFVAGDTRKKALRQVITAAADGANAVYSMMDYLGK